MLEEVLLAWLGSDPVDMLYRLRKRLEEGRLDEEDEEHLHLLVSCRFCGAVPGQHCLVPPGRRSHRFKREADVRLYIDQYRRGVLLGYRGTLRISWSEPWTWAPSPIDETPVVSPEEKLQILRRKAYDSETVTKREAALLVGCPQCSMKEGHGCVRLDNRPYQGFHRQRTEKGVSEARRLRRNGREHARQVAKRNAGLVRQIVTQLLG